jgi:hypothetical protein
MKSSFLRRGGVLVATPILAVSLVACGGSTATSAPVTAAPPASAAVTPEPAATASAAAATPAASLATTGRIAFPDKGFAVTLPDGWTRIDLQAQDLDALLSAASAANPQLAKAYSAQIKAMLGSGLVLFAFGPNPAAGTNVNILVAPNFGVSMDLLEQATLAQLKSVADGQVSSDRVKLPAGEALHLQYAVSAGNLAAAPSIDQYILVTNDSQYIVSVTNAAKGEAAGIAASIELLD